MVTLSVLALTGGFVEIPGYLGDVPALSGLMSAALPVPPSLTAATAASRLEGVLVGIAAFLAVLGVAVAFVAVLHRPAFVTRLVEAPAGLALQRFWAAGWGFDWFYDRTLTRPYVWLARLNRADAVDAFYAGIAWLSEAGYRLLSRSQTGQVRWYAAGVAFGSATLVILAVFA